MVPAVLAALTMMMLMFVADWGRGPDGGAGNGGSAGDDICAWGETDGDSSAGIGNGARVGRDIGSGSDTCGSTGGCAGSLWH